MYTNRKYAIIKASEVFTIDFSEVLEDSEETLKYSIDRSKTYVKWDGDTPSFLKTWIHLGKTEICTYKEALTLFSTPDWVELSLEEQEEFENGPSE